MIKSTKLHSEYRRHLNRVNSAYSKSVSTADADGYLNEAIDTIFENFAIKYETNSLLRNHLRQLEVKNFCASCDKIDDNSCKITYPEDFYMLTRQWGKGRREGCDERIINIYVIQTSDISNSLKDPFWKPSWEWAEAFADEAGNSLIVYHNNEFKLDSVCIDYLRRPGHIAAPSLASKGYYIDASGGRVSADQGFEIDSTFFWRKVTRLAAINTLLDMGDINDYQAQLNNILSMDKIFT